MTTKFIFTALLLCNSWILISQQNTKAHIEGLIQSYKYDVRGPYKDIRWFCKNGSIILPKEKCPEPGGVQRARYKDEVQNLAKTDKIYLGQILSTTSIDDFWDNANRHSRAKQYQIERYLRNVDDGWILRKAQFYRGAMQEEDEETWGLEFFNKMLADKSLIEQDYFLLRQLARDIPHKGDNQRAQEIRSLSKVISDAYTPFVELRVKIHGQPEPSDIEKVKRFKTTHQTKLNADLSRQMDALILSMEKHYQGANLNSVGKFLSGFSSTNPLKVAYTDAVANFNTAPMNRAKLKALAELLFTTRQTMTAVSTSKTRLALIDFSLGIEEIIFRDIHQYEPKDLRQIIDKSFYLTLASTGCGYLEFWEWKERIDLFEKLGETLQLQQLIALHQQTSRWVEWGSEMFRAHYNESVELFDSFEPLTHGFIDDRIRSSVLLPLGMVVSQLGDKVAREAGYANKVMNIPNQTEIRGLNPGYAKGELVVVAGSAEDIPISKEKIYVFNRPSSDLKPVAGIATVTEGNAVSHVQLLARNLGIPNAVFSMANLNALKPFSGTEVFFAVSNGGTVIMKPANQMTSEERQLFEVKKRKEERITVPIDKINLNQRKPLDLREVNAASSGKLCGPKAANLGQLKLLFPEKVVEGMVLPFGIFRAHLDQNIPGSTITYWGSINNTFEVVRQMEKDECSDAEIENYVTYQLAKLRKAIQAIPFLPDFENQIASGFKNILGGSIGSVPVFLRSDTNMEDLKDFTGAGLNLTLFNVVDKAKIMQGIKDVWASPYTERSYKWRQQYLLNPENVFPSILIIPSVDVDKSGVLITKGLSNNESNDLTIAFNRGAGGAVDGQAAESYLLPMNGNRTLLAPAREPYYRKLPSTGGTTLKAATFEQPILNDSNRKDIRQLAADIKRLLSDDSAESKDNVYDVEFGFKDDHLWLFQIRPFVENKNALSSNYLISISPKIPKNKTIALSQN